MTVSTANNLFASVRCPVRILIVADGGIHFGQFVNGFGLSELIKSLHEAARPWESLTITTARRGDDGDNCTKNTNFRFDPSTFNMKLYDQVWLFGHEEETDTASFLDESELRTIYDFMNAGGGVFATGDHKSLGYALCGNIPRVSSMRKWQYETAPSPDLKAPGRDDTTRLDTLREGSDAGFQRTDQSDSIPQEIRPKFYANLGGVGSHPHPLLADRDFAITVLPDHQHEGECMLPKDRTKSFKFDGGESFDEYPILPRSTKRSSPDLVAIATSAGGYLRGDIIVNVPPVEPRCFNAIVAYDGHLVERTAADGSKTKLGRVVVESTFHHFLDINLNGTGSSDPTKKGFYDAWGQPTRNYKTFKKYYRNIVTWLYPERSRFKYYLSLLLYLRFTGALIEEFPAIPTLDSREIIYAGTVTMKSMTEMFSRSEAVTCALALLSALPPEFSFEIERLINPWLPSALHPSPRAALINSDLLVRSILGIAILTVASKLPRDPFEAHQKLDQSEDLRNELADFVIENTKRGVSPLFNVINQWQIAISALEQVP